MDEDVTKELSEINFRLGLNERWGLLEDVVDLLTKIHEKLDDIDNRLASIKADTTSIRSDVSSIDIKTD